MRNAVIFTGALRTIRKTIKYFKENVMQYSPDVFICVQNDTSHIESDWNLWFKEHLGDNLVSIEWFSLDKYPEWEKHRETQLSCIQLDNGWKDYLRTSGSMIEYFQLQLAYMKMCHHEQVNAFRYDYVIRARTDSIYTKPVDFHWLQWTDTEIAERLTVIQKELELTEIECSPKNILQYFMCTILSDDVIPNIKNILADYSANETDTVLLYELTAERLQTYIHHGRYILTFRKNNLYLVKRNLFQLIPTLGTMYGFMRSPIADAYWFNAEGQFRDACYYSCVSIFDYNTLFEDKSVLSANIWNSSDFFDGDELVNKQMLYCVVRK